MNKIESEMVYKIFDYSNIVPNVRNNCSMADIARYRFDAM